MHAGVCDPLLRSPADFMANVCLADEKGVRPKLHCGKNCRRVRTILTVPSIVCRCVFRLLIEALSAMAQQAGLLGCALGGNAAVCIHIVSAGSMCCCSLVVKLSCVLHDLEPPSTSQKTLSFYMSSGL